TLSRRPAGAVAMTEMSLILGEGRPRTLARLAVPAPIKRSRSRRNMLFTLPVFHQILQTGELLVELAFATRNCHHIKSEDHPGGGEAVKHISEIARFDHVCSATGPAPVDAGWR